MPVRRRDRKDNYVDHSMGAGNFDRMNSYVDLVLGRVPLHNKNHEKRWLHGDGGILQDHGLKISNKPMVHQGMDEKALMYNETVP